VLPIILNQSDGKLAFDNLARMLSRSLWIDISENPGDLNYILCTDTELIDNSLNSFIPLNSIKIASDKREIEKRFKTDGIYNHVDRDLENNTLLHELNERLAIAFWKRLRTPI
jgi:hypothetical protein